LKPTVDPLVTPPIPRSPGRLYGVLGIPTISYLPADDVDDSALPAGELIQHLEDDVDGWWVSATRYGETIEIRIYDVATVWLDASLAFCTVRPAFDVGEGWLAFQLERHVLPIVRMMQGRAVFHAGAVHTKYGAVLLLADGHGGKSTTTALMLADGADFISDDQTAVTTALEAIGTPWLRLRQPSAALAPIGIDTRVEGDGRTVVALQPLAGPTPIAGMLLLGGRSRDDTVTLERVEGAAAVTALLGQVFCGGLVDAALVERHFTIATDLAARLPVARLAVPHGPPWPTVLAEVERWLADYGRADD
jgi:hypothetical protein